MSITLYNTAARAKEPFAPIDPENVRMYLCGPTVYDRAHLGNARPVLVFDVLYRLLRHEYGHDHVTYVRNFTDVDDKINATALARQEAGAPGTLEELIADRTDETIEWYHADMDALGALRPTHEPRATQYIEEMKTMIAELEDKGFAYSVAATIGHNSNARYVFLDSERVPAHAFLSVDDYSRNTDETYGRLSGRSVDDMIAGSRAELGEGKRNPMDSVLWKPSTLEQPGWESKWGFGRPGWHIECSAMARDLLGPSFDIHGGGLDLAFPHHENERAHCVACDGAEASARFWLHNEMLQVEGKKMSKSLGNFFTVRDLLDQGVPGEVIRFVMLSTHYRKPMDWTEKKRAEAEKTLRKWVALLDGAEARQKPHLDVIAALADDLNTPLAITLLHQHANAVSDGVSAGRFAATLSIMGLEFDHTSAVRKAIEAAYEKVDLLDAVIERLRVARSSKDYALADALKSGLSEAGVKVMITKDGIERELEPGFDPAKLEALK